MVVMVVLLNVASPTTFKLPAPMTGALNVTRLAVSVVLANLAAELLYGWLDPRVREA